MSCINCDKIRKAILHGRMAEAAGLTMEVFRQKFGLSDEGAPLVVGEAGPEVMMPDPLPSLSGKNKADLLAIAAAEGVEVPDNATNADIVDAIEAHRETVTA